MLHVTGAVAKNDVNRKPHPKGVHLLGGFENESAPGFQIDLSSQTPCSLSSGLRPGDIARQNSLGGFNHNRAGHVK